MIENDVWPVVFVGWKSKAKDFCDSFQKGQVESWTGKMHARKGAAFLAVLEDGKIVASGTIVNSTERLHEISLRTGNFNVDAAPVLRPDLIDKVRAIPKPFLKAPVTAFLIPPDQKEGVFSTQWFLDAYSFVEHISKDSIRTTTSYEHVSECDAGNNEPNKLPKTKKCHAPETVKDDEREAMLKGWIPPVLQGLLAERVRADQWEVLVAYAFRALGCQVNYLGAKAGAKAVPDCIARYASPTGQLIELVIDAKAGQWNASVDDIRAMRDYVEVRTPYAYPLFVANSLTKDVPEKLRQHNMHGKTARAIDGRDLAFLITRRLMDPSFDVEFELRQFFL